MVSLCFQYIYYSQNIKKSKKIEKNHLRFLRPYLKKGAKIDEYKNLVGLKLKINVKKNQLVLKEHFSKWII